MEITPERSQFVDFTRPYLTGKLAALVKRTDADVQNGVDENEESDLFKVLRQNKVAVINGSLVERFWKTFDHSIVSLPVNFSHFKNTFFSHKIIFFSRIYKQASI